jgi:hypothetical protein
MQAGHTDYTINIPSHTLADLSNFVVYLLELPSVSVCDVHYLI